VSESGTLGEFHPPQRLWAHATWRIQLVHPLQSQWQLGAAGQLTPVGNSHLRHEGRGVNIGLVLPGFSADASDWCIPALRHLARCLAARDRVRVIALRYPYAAGRYTVDGADVLALGGALSHRASTLDLWRQALGVLRSEHRAEPFDVLHAFWATESGLLAAVAGRMLGVPTLVSLAGGELVALRDIGYGDQRIAWERLKIAASLRLATHVSAGSRQLQARAHRHLRGSKHIELAPLGVDEALFSPAPGQSGQRILHAGTLVAVKDQATLLRAFALMRQHVSDACLDIIGDGPLLVELQQLAASLRLDGSVRFRGAVDHAELAATYRGAAVCAVSSRHEAQCMVALEAAACGVPLAGTCVGVLPELTSAVAPVADPPALARAMVAALSAPNAIGPTIEELRAHFGLQASTDRFRGLYRNAR